ncbi:MAG: FAD-binding oxidoreductase, partial [Chloroflexota bacterium]
VVGITSPRTEAELRKLIWVTRESGVPLVPRGAGTSPFGGAAASEGIVLSFQSLNRVLDIDKARQLVRVQPGLVWRDLMDDLRPHVLMPRVYPGSAASSTVGGFVAQGGVGVGSFQYGSIAHCVESARLIRGDGESVNLRGQSLELVVGAEGRTGILVDIVLRLRPLAAMEPLVAVFNRATEIEACLTDVARRALPLWSVSIMDRSAVDLQGRRRPNQFPLPLGRYAALFSFRAPERLQVLPKLRGSILASGGRLFPTPVDHDAWIGHFMGLQALGTTPIPMQFRLPPGTLAELISTIRPELRSRLAFEGVVGDTARCLTVRFFLLDRPETAEENFEAARELLALTKRVGGNIYATGAFFLEEAEDVFGPDRLARMAAFREDADPDGRLNPGKAFGPALITPGRP